MKIAEITKDIIYIVNSDPYARISTDGKTAKEIDNCIKEYAQECPKDCYPKEFITFLLTAVYFRTGDTKFWVTKGDLYFETLDELFTYWKENIKQ